MTSPSTTVFAEGHEILIPPLLDRETPSLCPVFWVYPLDQWSPFTFQVNSDVMGLAISSISFLTQV